MVNSIAQNGVLISFTVIAHSIALKELVIYYVYKQNTIYMEQKYLDVML